jgi:hypothetical protein
MGLVAVLTVIAVHLVGGWYFLTGRLSRRAALIQFRRDVQQDPPLAALVGAMLAGFYLFVGWVLSFGWRNWTIGTLVGEITTAGLGAALFFGAIAGAAALEAWRDRRKQSRGPG